MGKRVKTEKSKEKHENFKVPCYFKTSQSKFDKDAAELVVLGIYI